MSCPSLWNLSNGPSMGVGMLPRSNPETRPCRRILAAAGMKVLLPPPTHEKWISNPPKKDPPCFSTSTQWRCNIWKTNKRPIDPNSLNRGSVTSDSKRIARNSTRDQPWQRCLCCRRPPRPSCPPIPVILREPYWAERKMDRCNRRHPLW